MRPPKPKTKNMFFVCTLPGHRPSPSCVANIKEICESSLKNRYDLEVIDIYQQPVLMKGEQIIAAPTLVKNCRYLCASSLATCLIPNGYL